MIDVLFLLLPGSLILDWAGPAEALRIANWMMRQQGKAEPFALRFCAPRPDTISSVGVRLADLEALPATLAPHPSWVVLVGQTGTPIGIDSPDTRALLDWLRPLRLVPGKLELMTICAGAVLAAHAGLLAGRRATTHHHHLDELQAVAPQCEVVRNRVFVEDSPIFSSAGVTTGIDLILHRIEAICGPALAAQVAQTMVVALRRGPHDPELSPFLAYRNHVHPALHRVQDAVSQSPQSDWSVPGMAAVAHTSPRHLTRLFLEYAQIAPLQYLRRIRLAVAQTALASGNSVTEAAAAAGFSSDTQLRRAWQHFAVPGTPSRP
ncbi:MAG TPA: helix-turn-helix domain-containing protein [Telluria sp.]|jgi:transcriptional regulator GlxA family with amidase domain